MKMLKSKKGFTLIELIIVIAILGIIALIAVPNLAGIRQRSQVSADKRTAEQIGKAVRIWLTDVDAGSRSIYTAEEVANKATAPLMSKKYDDSFTGLCPTYISAGYTAKSLAGGTAGNFYISSLEGDGVNNANEKIYVYIGTASVARPTTAAEANYDGTAAGLAYVEK